MPKQAVSNEEIEKCFPVIFELRPHLVKDLFLKQVRDMENEGFKLAYIVDSGQVVSVAGYRISTTLFMGKHLYVDDLITLEKDRSKGYGDRMVTWLRLQARDNNCHYLHLDSGTQRHSAHKFYFRQGLSIASYHFSEKLQD